VESLQRSVLSMYLHCSVTVVINSCHSGVVVLSLYTLTLL
jgi:hypothetical protein